MSPADALPPLDLVVAWVPRENRSWSLTLDAPTVLPALLYADKITLICPESDDFLEVGDFPEIYEAFDGATDERYTQMLWMGLRTKAAYLPG